MASGIDVLSEAELAKARERGAEAARTEPRARAARYDDSSGRVVVELTNGCVFEFPSALAQGLRGASADELREVEVLPGGRGIHWDSLDADLSVPGLIAGVFGSERWMAEELGRRGGAAKSEAKARAAQANGRKGGRPRKKKEAGEAG
jgi:hypothetical protein